MSDNTAGAGHIDSVDTLLSILEALHSMGPSGVTEVAEAADVAKSTAHHYLKTAVSAGYVERVGDKYALGLRFLSLGGRARERQRLFHLGRDDVDRLASKTGEKARIIVEREWQGITLYQAEGEQISGTNTYVGSSEQLHSTAAGKALLAAVSESEMEAYLEATDLAARTENTITDREQLLAELEQTEDRGIAFDDEEHYDGVRCVAVPIVAAGGDILGALSVSAPTNRMSEARFRSEIPGMLQNVAGVVEVNTTYSEWVESL